MIQHSNQHQGHGSSPVSVQDVHEGEDGVVDSPDDASSLAEAELAKYRDDPGVSPEDLDARIPLHPGKPAGRWWEYALYGF